MSTSDAPVMTSISLQLMRVWRVAWMGIATLATIAVVVMLLWPPPARQASAQTKVEAPPEAARLDSEGDILIPAGSSLAQKLSTALVQPESVAFPVLHVNGFIIARLVAGESRIEDRWQFASEEISTTYSDGVKSETEIENAGKQLNTITDLAQSNIQRYEKIVARLRKLV